MPLLSSGLVVVTDPVEDIETGPTVAYFETVGIPNFTWIDPDGTEWPLSNTSEQQGWFTIMGPSGWGAAPIEITSDPLPRGGEAVRAIASKPATIQWPLEIFGASHEEFVDRYRRISKAFKLTTWRQKPGILRVQRPSGSVREIEAYYSDGLAGEGEQNHLFARPVVTLWCPDGKWRASAPVVAVRTFTATTTSTPPPGSGGGTDPGTGTPVSFFSPFLSVTSSHVVGSGAPAGGDDTGTGGDSGGGTGDNPNSLTAITNGGDVEAWPVWTITGPLTQLRAWNATLGESSRFALTYPLGDQQTITITTDRPTVRGPGDSNLSKYIDWFNPAGTELFPLSDGLNVVGLEVDGAGVNTAVQLAFTPRYDNS